MNIKTVCERNMCTGCGACVEICKKSLYGHAIAIWRGIIKNYVDI